MLLDVTDRLVVIIGGGKVAARKADGVIAAGAVRVRCVSLAFCAELNGAVERIAAEYADVYLDDADLVFAATDRPEVNDAIVRDARRRGIWVNRADSDDAEPGDFITPARIENGPVIVTVSAGSAALSAAVRDDLADKLDQRQIRMAEAMKILRPQIRRSSLDAAGRTKVFRELAGEESLARLEAGGFDGLRAWLHERYPELKNA